MRELNLTLPDEAKAPYLRLAAALRACLQQGQLSPGELLPSTRRLASLVGIHRHTVLAALDELVAEGWLGSEPGRGYRVSSMVPEECLPPAPPGLPGPQEFCWEGRVQIPISLPDPPQVGLPYSFPSGQPDLRLFPAQEYFGLIREVLRQSRPEERLAYADPAGDPVLRDELAVYLRRMRGLVDVGSRDEVLVTHGSQEGIYLLGQLLLGPGQVAAVEELGYPPAWEALRAAGAELVGLPVDREGVDPEALQRALEGGRVGLIYLTPLHQYPTTVTLSRSRRLAIYGLAARYRVPILEDDYDHEFHYRCQPLPPMKAEDPLGLVLYCSTFSKVLYPGARLGFLVVPRTLAGPLARLKQVVSRQNDTLTQRAVASWMQSGGFERHLRRMRRVYERRLVQMLESLRQEAREHGLPLQVEPPDGGMCLWMSLGCQADSLSERAAGRGVMVRPPRAYRLTPRAGSPEHLRLGFASANLEEITQGIGLLCQAACELSGSSGSITRAIKSTR